VLKTPREYRTSAAEGGGGASETRRVAPNAPSTYSRPVPRASQAARADSEYAGEATEALPAVTPRTRPRAAQSPNGAGAGRAVGVRPLAWPWRLLVWIVALPIGLLIVFFVARWLGLLTGNNLFDVISGSGIGRYLRLFAIAPFAALVIATMAHFALERLPAVLERRRASRRGGGGGGGGVAYDDAYNDSRAGARGAPQRAGRPAGRRTTS
jgi:hypothetical protein